jgi:hypothetical protein
MQATAVNHGFGWRGFGTRRYTRLAIKQAIIDSIMSCTSLSLYVVVLRLFIRLLGFAGRCVMNDDFSSSPL